MRRFTFVVVLALALLIATQPMLHQHSLGSERAVPCSVCAFGNVRIVVAPSISAPIVLAYTITAAVVIAPLAEVARTISSRGPPPSA